MPALPLLVKAAIENPGQPRIQFKCNFKQSPDTTVLIVIHVLQSQLYNTVIQFFIHSCTVFRLDSCTVTVVKSLLYNDQPGKLYSLCQLSVFLHPVTAAVLLSDFVESSNERPGNWSCDIISANYKALFQQFYCLMLSSHRVNQTPVWCTRSGSILRSRQRQKCPRYQNKPILNSGQMIIF